LLADAVLREPWTAFLNDPVALSEVKVGVLPMEFVMLAADALWRADFSD
jgi:hypothetical protein